MSDKEKINTQSVTNNFEFTAGLFIIHVHVLGILSTVCKNYLDEKTMPHQADANLLIM